MYSQIDCVILTINEYLVWIEDSTNFGIKKTILDNDYFSK